MENQQDSAAKVDLQLFDPEVLDHLSIKKYDFSQFWPIKNPETGGRHTNIVQHCHLVVKAVLYLRVGPHEHLLSFL